MFPSSGMDWDTGVKLDRDKTEMPAGRCQLVPTWTVQVPGHHQPSSLTLGILNLLFLSVRAGAAPLPLIPLVHRVTEHSGASNARALDQGDLGAVPTQLTGDTPEQEVLQSWALTRAVPLAWQVAGMLCLPRSLSQQQHGLAGMRRDRRNCASISEHKDSHHLHFPLPRAAHSRQDARATSSPYGASSCRAPARRERAGTGAAPGGSALSDPVAVNSSREPSTTFCQTQLPLRESRQPALDEAWAVCSHSEAQRSAGGHDIII